MILQRNTLGKWGKCKMRTKWGPFQQCGPHEDQVLNWRLGLHEVQTAEMVLILHKRSNFPHFPSVFLCNIMKKASCCTCILLGNGIIKSPTIMNILTFDVKCVMLFLKIFRHFDENNDLGSSKAHFTWKVSFFPHWQVFHLESSNQDSVQLLHPSVEGAPPHPRTFSFCTWVQLLNRGVEGVHPPPPPAPLAFTPGCNFWGATSWGCTWCNFWGVEGVHPHPLRLQQVLVKPRKTTAVHWRQREGGLLSLVKICPPTLTIWYSSINWNAPTPAFTW